jgi:hypothetical protein
VKTLIGLVLVLAASVHAADKKKGDTAQPEQTATEKAAAQTASRIRIDKARVFVMDIEKGLPKSITGGFDVTVLAEKPGEKDVRLRGGEMEFIGDSGKGPERVVLKDNVLIDHPQGAIRAEKAEWDFVSNQLVFTGNPVFESDKVKGGRAAKIELNLNTNQMIFENLQTDEITIPSGGSPGGGPSEATAGGILSASDVKNWPALLTKIKSQAQEQTASPGKQLLSVLTSKDRETFMSFPTEKEPSGQIKAMILGRFNRALDSPRFYNPDAWKGITLSEEMQEIAKKDLSSLPKADLGRFNRSLIEAAFPGEIEKKN